MKFDEALLNIWRSELIRNIAMMSGGVAGAQIIALMFTPLITRIYGPEVYGLFGVFVSLAAIVSTIAALAYPIAIVLPKADADARNLTVLSLAISTVIAIFACIAVFIIKDNIISALGLERVAGLLWLIPLLILFSAWLQIGQQWLLRKKDFYKAASAAIIYAIVVNGFKTFFGMFAPTATTIIALHTFGLAFYALLLSRKGCFRSGYELLSYDNTKLGETFRIATRYKDFALYRAPQNFINAASLGLPVLILSGLFSPAVAGLYTLARTIMGMPGNLLAQAVGSVLYPHLATSANNKQPLLPVLLRATYGLAIIGFLPFACLFFFGPTLFSLVFGAEWSRAGDFARWLAVFYYMNFVNRPSVAAVAVLGIQKGLLIYELTSTGGKIISLFMGFFLFKSDLAAVMFYAVTGATTYFALIGWVLITARQFDRRNNCGRSFRKASQ